MPASSSSRGGRVLLGVTGGVGAFKAVLLLRLLRKAGHEVRVVLTRSARRFVGEATFHALSGTPVHHDAWALDRTDAGELHVELADWADAMIVYPATANFCGGLAAGLADDLLRLTATCFDGPRIVAPAMHSRMAAQPAHRRALEQLAADGVTVLPSVVGELASGEVGPGRLPEPEVAFEAVVAALTPQDLAGRRIVVTAGPTREHADPVRFLSNPSTGRMGYAVAQAAARRGASVTLISGPVALTPPPGVEDVVRITSADELREAVSAATSCAHALVMTAAVADWRPASVASTKQAKQGDAQTLALERTPDILAGVAADPDLVDLFVVGFAMETGDLEAKARAKLERKGLDLIVANDLTVDGAGFATETNVVTLISKDGAVTRLDRRSKLDVGHEVLDRIAAALG